MIYFSKSYYKTLKDFRLNSPYFCIYEFPSNNEKSLICRENNTPRELYEKVTNKPYCFICIHKSRKSQLRTSMKQYNIYYINVMSYLNGLLSYQTTYGTPGERGPQGFSGDKGDRGDTSALGPKGDAGLALNVSSNVDMKNYSIENVANPKNVCDAISNDILTGINTFRGNINMNNHKIVNLATPTNNADATNKTYVDTLVNTSVKLDGSNTRTGSLNVGNNKIINVPAPTTGTDATNKTYVDKHEHNG